jgi:arsenate reductase
MSKDSKILFVCRANSGRSQIAMELYNHIRPEMASSAGTHVDEPGQKIKDRPTAASAIEVMSELGIDMRENTRTQLTPELLQNFDHVVVLAETRAIPDYLNTWVPAEMWHIEDTRERPIERVRQIRDEIKRRVDELATRYN